MYRTVDGGQTWARIAEGDLPGASQGSPTPTTNTLPTTRGSYDLLMLDDRAGWIADEGGIDETTDGGRTWKGIGGYWRGAWQAYPLDGLAYVRAVAFLTKTHGFVLREAADNLNFDVGHLIAVLYESTDGGATWTQIQCGFGSPCALSTQTPSP